METSDITVHILREIRDSIATLTADMNTRLDATNTRLDTTIARLDTAIERIDHMEGYLGSELAGLRRDVATLRPIGDGNAIVRRVAKCEQDIAELKKRLP